MQRYFLFHIRLVVVDCSSLFPVAQPIKTHIGQNPAPDRQGREPAQQTAGAELLQPNKCSFLFQNTLVCGKQFSENCFNIVIFLFWFLNYLSSLTAESHCRFFVNIQGFCKEASNHPTAYI